MAKHTVSRRAALAAWTAALTVGSVPGFAQGAALTDLEKASIRIVNDFCASPATRDASRLAAFFTENSRARINATNPGLAPLAGRAAIETFFADFFKHSTVEFDVLDTLAKGPMVLNYRLDRIRSSERPARDLYLLGVFFVADGKIQDWSDFVIPRL